MDERISDLARKLLALVERGATDGERDAAQRKLDALLNKHGLRLEDLAEETRQKYEFEFKGEFERRLLAQIVLMVLNRDEVEVTRYKRTRNKRIYELTTAEYAQVRDFYANYRLALATHFEDAFIAFLAVNKIHPDTVPSDKEEKLAQSDIEKIQRRQRLMRGMEAIARLGVKLIEGA